MTNLLGFRVLTHAVIMAVSLVIPISAIHAGEQGDLVIVADGLQAALKNSDESALRAILDEDVLIFESGGVESSFAEYASHHMGADMSFMQGIEREILSRTVTAQGDLGVVITRSRLSGTYRNRPSDISSNETLVLQRQEQGWRVIHIHWSAK